MYFYTIHFSHHGLVGKVLASNFGGRTFEPTHWPLADVKKGIQSHTARCSNKVPVTRAPL